MEIYNGTSWTEVGDTNQQRFSLWGTGTTTAGIVAGGSISGGPNDRSALTEEYDGSSWTEVGDLSVARYQAGSSGTQASGLLFGGGGQPETPTSGVHTTTEAWTGDSVTAATVTSS